LGELALPNLTEKMKNPSVRVAGCMTWKFVLERIQVTPHHREVAAVLLSNLRLKTSHSDASSAATSKAGTANTGLQSGLGTRPPTHTHRNAISGKLDVSGLDFSSLSFLTATDEEANTLVSSLNGSVNGSASNAASAVEDDAITIQSKRRERLVRSLQEPPSYLDDAPPAKVLSREERKEQARQDQLLALSSSVSLPELHSLHSSRLAANTHANTHANSHIGSNSSVMTDSLSSMHSIFGGANNEEYSIHGNNNVSSNMSVSSLGSVGSASIKSIGNASVGSLKSQHTEQQSLASQQSLWMTTDDYCDNAGGKVSFTSLPAFSEGSLNTSWNQGAIGAEEYNILRRVSSQNDKILVYDRSVPLVLMRNVKLTANVQLPDEKTVKRSEISFGVQKVRC
jgi:hypothetical protein